MKRDTHTATLIIRTFDRPPHKSIHFHYFVVTVELTLHILLSETKPYASHLYRFISIHMKNSVDLHALFFSLQT